MIEQLPCPEYTESDPKVWAAFFVNHMKHHNVSGDAAEASYDRLAEWAYDAWDPQGWNADAVFTAITEGLDACAVTFGIRGRL